VARNRCIFFDLATYPPIARLRNDLARLKSSDADERHRLENQLRRNTQALFAKVIQHEAAHQVQANLGLVPDDAPPWLAEGLAQLFELPLVERGATLQLWINRYRLAEFSRLHADPSTWGSQLRRITGDERGWHGGADYSLGWALTDFLYKRHRTRLAEYLRDLAAPDNVAHRSGPREQFERAFGPIDEEFVARFRRYMQRLQARHAMLLNPPATSRP
jgi:hypothetical protein